MFLTGTVGIYVNLEENFFRVRRRVRGVKKLKTKQLQSPLHHNTTKKTQRKTPF